MLQSAFPNGKEMRSKQKKMWRDDTREKAGSSFFHSAYLPFHSMATPPTAAAADGAPAVSTDKPLRQRLFSLSRKKQKDGTASGDEKTIEGVGHTAETSASTSSEYSTQCIFVVSFLSPHNDPATLADELPISADEPGQAPSPAPAAEPLSVSMAAMPDDKERGSLNTTLTGNNKRTMFYHRKGNKSSTSQAAVSSSTSHSIVKPSPPHRPRSKPTLLTRVVYKLMPCVGPDATTMDDVLSNSQMVEIRQSEAGPQTATSEASASSNLDASALLVALPTINIERPPSRADSEIIVQPPPSAHLLPEDETDGLTSGAVQPPGSTGELIARTHTRDSSEESDGTSFTDDEGDDRRAYDEQAQEERLIKNGGSGIPIGPVCEK